MDVNKYYPNPLSISDQRKYVKLAELYQNSVKKVFKAVDKEKGISVVWNECFSDVKGSLNRLIREFEMLRSLEGCDEFVKIFDWWLETEPERSIWVSEMVSCTILNFLERSDGVSIAVIKSWLCQILNAVIILHEKRIIHRNLCLSCIYYEGSLEGKIKIGDLGTAITVDSRNAAYQGNCHYMAPEFHDQNGYNTDVDLWGYGMCILEMSTRVIPYMDEFGDNNNYIINAVTNGLKPACLANIESPLEIIDLISICLHRDPGKRFCAKDLENHPFIMSASDEEKDEYVILKNQIKEKNENKGENSVKVDLLLNTAEKWDNYLASKLSLLEKQSWYLFPENHKSS